MLDIKSFYIVKTYQNSELQSLCNILTFVFKYQKKKKTSTYRVPLCVHGNLIMKKCTMKLSRYCTLFEANHYGSANVSLQVMHGCDECVSTMMIFFTVVQNVALGGSL